MTGRSRSPSTTCRSVRQQAQAWTLTRASPAAGTGSGRSSSVSGRRATRSGASSTWALTRPTRSSSASRHRERGLALDRRAAALLAGHDEVEVDAALSVLLVAALDRRFAGEVVSGPDLLAELHREAAHVLRSQPVGAVAAEDPGLQHPDREHRRKPG